MLFEGFRPGKETEISHELKERLIELLNQECDYTLPASVMEEFLNLGRCIKLDKLETLIHSGDYNPNLYIAIDGILRCWYWDGDREKTAFFSTIPTMFLNYHSYYGGKGSFYSYQACTPATLLCIRREDLNEMLRKSHEFTLWILRMTQCQEYFFEVKHSVNMGLAKEKYRSLISTLPHVMREVPLQYIASYLDITPQYLSKLRKEMRE